MEYFKYIITIALVSLYFLAGYVSNISMKNKGDLVPSPTLSRLDLGVGHICSFLQDNLWEPKYASDSALILIVPVEYAFYRENERLKSCFKQYVNRLQNLENKPENLSVLSWLEHLHMVSRYAVLAQDIQLMKWLHKEFIYYWREYPAWLWDRPDFKGVVERIRWKLDKPDSDVHYSYYNVIFDEDYFALSLGVDLYGFLKHTNALGECKECVEAVELFTRIFRERLTWFEDGGWVIDEGKWRNHPDFAYAAYLKEPVNNKGELLKKSTFDNITVDSSHAIRYPSWLRSAELAEIDADFVNKLQKGLYIQFVNHVLINDTRFPAPVLNNYMSGHNGYYRYGYETQTGHFKGYGPYALSGTFPYGGWSLVGGDKITFAYQKLLSAYPLSEEILHIYADSSTRDIHQLLKNAWTNGFLEAVAEMAVEISSKHSWN